MSRRKARETAFKVVFQVDQVQAEVKKAFDYLVENDKLAEKNHGFSWELARGTLEKQAEIDRMIASYSREWALDRMSSVDRNIMRVAAFEILFLEDSQAVVAIDEAIEIAKKYGDEGSASFVNAILDKILGEKNEQFPGN
ncbi:MAG: transcription antitermination factor NusB [Syntrophomonas sp.]|uniref:transcription antitermination factor NusB n=1 Tax=Syntrophomonas sp. TaxID=2053627 RepID=UPI0026301389|nr:transcription antitermination factor NusB [Syntrophomonas sp.]MDD2510251.1 transcription antitermination factor NusB [Syntrophomonas sp.]MDD3878809.1 transcription antitermination factor NusB [Syntrophomonas sp.]MDD4626835.1 transcription antitermination factor NusB [Syntrophomonas sp.]